MGQRGRVLRSRDARFQQWQALLTNRAKRHRAGVFLVHGVRSITLAVEHGWQVGTWLVRDTPTLSAWAREQLAGSAAERVVLADDLLAELSEKNEHLPELVALVRRRNRTLADLADLAAGPPPHLADRAAAQTLVMAFDRPSSPGNLGTLIRSADAFGAVAVVVTGHAADPTDPRTVRASTGSVFAVPVITLAGPAELRTWADAHAFRILGADERADTDVDAADLSGALVLAVGNETVGLSAAWLQACDELVAIPIGGSASSLNAATAGSLLLYEAARQRRFPRRGQAVDRASSGGTRC